MYCGDLRSIVEDGLVAYADDAYVLISGDNTEEVGAKTIDVMTRHVSYLHSIGMVVNVSKTESVLFSKSVEGPVLLTVNGSSFYTTQSMNVLGVTFDAQLSWDPQTEKVINKAKGLLHGLRILRRNLGMKKYMKVLTAQFYSKIYYGASVWLKSVKVSALKRLESIHYRALRVSQFDFKGTISRDILDRDLQRATPIEWMDYCVATEMVRIFNTGAPLSLFERLRNNCYTVSRPSRIKVFDSSKTKIGKQCFENKCASVALKLDFPWFNGLCSKDKLRMKLKENLFKYPSSAVSLYVTGLTNQIREWRRNTPIDDTHQ